MRLREFNGEIRAGNLLLVDCCGIVKGEQHCGGKIRIPFKPPLPGCKPYKNGKYDAVVWDRLAGATVDDITLSPSIDAGSCGHFVIEEGEIVRS